MKLSAIFITILFVLIFCFSSFAVSNEIYDESYVVVEGRVTKSECSEKIISVRSDLIENQKRRNHSTFHNAPPATGKVTKMNVEVRSYCLRSLTSRGTPTRMGVIAVDPRVIPFGSKIYVPGYGWGTALDTGSAIKGHTIDIWMPTYNQCMQWGVRCVSISVIRPK